MKIRDVIFAESLSGFFNDDQSAIRSGATKDGEFYFGEPKAVGYSSVRLPSECTSIGLVLENDAVAWGDAMSVQYAGVEGREARFSSKAFRRVASKSIRADLIGQSVTSFKRMTDYLDLRLSEVSYGSMLAAKYGLSQALLTAVAITSGKSAYEVLCEEYGLDPRSLNLNLYSQSGDNRYANVDKMVQKRVDVLPHGLINGPSLFGDNGRSFRAYVEWVCDRIRMLGDAEYRPRLYFDVYGMPGYEFNMSTTRIADFLGSLETYCQPFSLTIESPANFGDLEEQISGYQDLRAELSKRGSDVKIAVDEWCNTVDDIRRFAQAGAADLIQIKMPDLGSIDNTIKAAKICRENDVGLYIGGSCTETDTSARIAVHVALAVEADMFLARPGMGVDESIMIATGEAARLRALVDSRLGRASSLEEAKSSYCL